jgi:hypothetical protein
MPFTATPPQRSFVMGFSLLQPRRSGSAVGGLPVLAIQYCLREAGLQLSEVDYVAVNQNSRAILAKS